MNRTINNFLDTKLINDSEWEEYQKLKQESKCKGCEWHNKPYWSITNPCDHCQKEAFTYKMQSISYYTEEYVKQLQQENKQLKQRISLLEENRDKAIEFLNLAQESGLISVRTIIEILKGEE